MINSLMILAYLLGQPQRGHPQPHFVLTSPVVEDHQLLPQEYTCYGKKQPIPLEWDHVPPGTRSLALLMIDLDLPRKKYYHWAVFNIPTNSHEIADGMVAANSWGSKSYYPPCPPPGKTHHYDLTLYALDATLPSRVNKSALTMRKKMQPHILASTHITAQVQGPPE